MEHPVSPAKRESPVTQAHQAPRATLVRPAFLAFKVPLAPLGRRAPPASASLVVTESRVFLDRPARPVQSDLRAKKDEWAFPASEATKAMLACLAFLGHLASMAQKASLVRQA